MAETLDSSTATPKVPHPGSRHQTANRHWSVRAHRANPLAQLREIWRVRFLIGHLVKQMLLTAYQRTILGVLWLFIRPFVMVVGYTFVFRDMLGVETGSVPYPVFVLCGLVGWLFFQRGLAWTTRGMYKNRPIIRRFYFPRILVYLCAFSPAVVESAIVLVCLLGTIAFYGLVLGVVAVQPGWNLLYVPLVLVWLAAAVSAITLFTSVLYMYAKDAWFILRYAIILMLFATPVLYPLDAVPANVQEWMLYNPLSSIFISLRAAVFGTAWPPMDALLSSLGAIGLLNALGFWFFIRWEATALDETV